MKRLKSGWKVTVAACVATVSLCFGALNAGAVTIESNTQLQKDTDYRGQGVMTIDAGVTLDLNGHKLYVDGLAGTGTVTDTTALGEDLIANGNFESTTITGNSGKWGTLNGAATSEDWSSDVPARAGFTKADSPWVVDVKGTYSAFIQRVGSLWQTVTVPEAGDYALTYSYKGRRERENDSHNLVVLVDGAARHCGKTTSTTAVDWCVNTVVLHLTADKHRIEFLGLETDDRTTVLDDVSLRKIPAAGELHVVVPENQTAEVSSVRLEGALKLVKEGAGTYLVSYRNGGVKTWYVGGTSVREGCFKVPPLSAQSSTDYSFILAQQLGAQGAETTVEKGATFDCGGNYDGYLYTIVLNGGTFCYRGTVNQARDTGTPLVLRLTDDSLVDATAGNIQIGDTDLAGHTLTVMSGSSCYPCGAIRNGTVISRGGRFFPRVGLDCSTADLVLEGTMSCAMGTVMVHDLKVTNTTGTFGHSDGDKNFYTVSGTYTPVSDRIYRFKLLNGSTIDLSGRTTALPVPDTNGLFFEENATVYVALGDRKVKSSEPLITWSAKPENVKFRAVPGAVGNFVAKDDGLYRNVGFGIIVR